MSDDLVAFLRVVAAVKEPEPFLCICGCGESADPGHVWRLACYRLELAYRSLLIDQMVARMVEPGSLFRISGV